MSLLQNNQFNTNSIISKRTKWYFFGAFVVLFVVYQIFWSHSGMGNTTRANEYADGMKVAATVEDSGFINVMYDKLNSVYNMINATDFDALTEFNNVPKEKLAPDFYTKLITYDLLDFTLDTLMMETRKGMPYESQYGYDSFLDNVNASAGNGNFINDFSKRNFHAGFANDARYMLNEKYVMVLLIYEFIRPSSSEVEKTFESGSCYAGIMVFDLSSVKMVAYESFVTSNSQEVTTGPFVKSKIDEELTKNLEDNITMHVNDASRKFFGKALWPINY